MRVRCSGDPLLQKTHGQGKTGRQEEACGKGRSSVGKDLDKSGRQGDTGKDQCQGIGKENRRQGRPGGKKADPSEKMILLSVRYKTVCRGSACMNRSPGKWDPDAGREQMQCGG